MKEQSDSIFYFEKCPTWGLHLFYRVLYFYYSKIFLQERHNTDSDISNFGNKQSCSTTQFRLAGNYNVLSFLILQYPKDIQGFIPIGRKTFFRSNFTDTLSSIVHRRIVIEMVNKGDIFGSFHGLLCFPKNKYIEWKIMVMSEVSPLWHRCLSGKECLMHISSSSHIVVNQGSAVC